ncbi:MAG: hypothetical protein SGILL_006588 [Bacillariaceae sp.]
MTMSPGRLAWFREREQFQPIKDNRDEQTMIAGVLYTHSEKKLKMTVMFPPLHSDESRRAKVYLTPSSLDKDSGGKVSERHCQIREGTWHCLVQFGNIPHDQEYTYEIQYTADASQDGNHFYKYDGMVPMQKDYPRIAGVGCFGPDGTKNKDALRDAIIAQNPDLVVFQGDQTYFHEDVSNAVRLVELGCPTVYTMGELTRNVPTIVQMDDHDFGQGNIWGAGLGDEDSGAGFEKSPCVVNRVQELALGHLPDPATTDTLDNGISVHYTNYIYGKTDLAVLESRKFKNFAAADSDSYFGSDQEAWVEEWCQDQDRLKVVLLQTPIVDIATNKTKNHGIVPMSEDFLKKADPGRDRFLDIVKGCSPLLLSGDQHLGVAVTYPEHGISECASPAAINDVFWRLNVMEPGTTSTMTGVPYTLLNAWNVDPEAIEWYEAARYSRGETDAWTRKRRAEGFLMVDLDGTSAACEMHGYHGQQEMIWDVTVPAADPSLATETRR